mmetsp:Transcript_92738/g.300047  ORF Transcript_92738/g.300047 Transcript_92738/m.300047 type:complete len:80 (+) Transcript_92738:478-717(+)
MCVGVAVRSKANSSIEILSLQNNRIGSIGARALADVVKERCGVMSFNPALGFAGFDIVSTYQCSMSVLDHLLDATSRVV